jgi:hypothetical protein
MTRQMPSMKKARGKNLNISFHISYDGHFRGSGVRLEQSMVMFVMAALGMLLRSAA